MSNRLSKTTKKDPDHKVDSEFYLKSLADIISENTNIEKDLVLNDPLTLGKKLKALFEIHNKVNKAFNNSHFKKLKEVNVSEVETNSLLVYTRKEFEVEVENRMKALLPNYNKKLAEINRKKGDLLKSEEYIIEFINSSEDDVVMIRNMQLEKINKKIIDLEEENKNLKKRVSRVKTLNLMLTILNNKKH